MNIKKGDQIRIISGNDRGKTGTVSAVFPMSGRIAADALNMKKKHVRPQKQGARGEIIRIPAPFPASRAMLVCPHCGKAVRVARRRSDESRGERVCRACARSQARGNLTWRISSTAS